MDVNIGDTSNESTTRRTVEFVGDYKIQMRLCRPSNKGLTFWKAALAPSD